MTTYETVTAAAARLHVHRSTVRRLAARDWALGVKGVEKFGKAWRLASDWQPVRVPVGHPRNSNAA